MRHRAGVRRRRDRRGAAGSGTDWRGSDRRASLDFSAALRRAGVRADAVTQDLIVVARDPDAARRLQKEATARREAGLESSWLTARAVAAESGLAASGGIRTKGEALDPYRA